jgi:O-antigen/teichoic acid export membrane protein
LFKIINKLLNLSIFTVFNGSINYYFQFYIAKHLNLLEYKIFNLSMSFSTFFGIPISILTILIIKETSKLFEEKKFFEINYLYKKTLIYITYFVILSFLILFLFLDHFKKILDVNNHLILLKLFILHANQNKVDVYVYIRIK